jgi:hypothetical protein
MQFLDFITAWEGKWLSQRTNYNFDQNEAANDKSDVTVDRLAVHDAAVQGLQAQVSQGQSDDWVVLQLSWDTSVDWGKPKQMGSIYYGFLPDNDNPNHGQLWRGTNLPTLPLLTGHYHLGEDECLTLNLQDSETSLAERHWYASPNLRLRTSLIQRGNGYSHSAFYSDIRRLPPAEKSD